MVIVGRLRQGVTIGETQAHMTALARSLERAYPVSNTGWTVNVQSMRDALFPETKLPLLVLLAAVAMLPAVACANVANLLLARYSSRTREIAPLIYRELRRMAQRKLGRQRPGHTLQSTQMVHEAYLKMVDQKRAEWHDREHFFAVAARMMRHILVSDARSRGALKRGARRTLLGLDETIAVSGWRDVDLVALDDAIDALEKLDAQQARIVELRFFSGVSIETTANLLGISPATVKRDRNVARAWLHRELSPRNDFGQYKSSLTISGRVTGSLRNSVYEASARKWPNPRPRSRSTEVRPEGYRMASR